MRWLVPLFLVLFLIFGCVSEKKETITIAGSTTVQRIVLEEAKAFMKKYPDIRVSVQGGGSGTGIRQVGEGIIDIGAASRELTEEERKRYPNLVATPIALDGIAVIVNPQNPVNDLTLEQVRKIFTGEIRNWKEVGGEDAEIVVVIREEGSGTRKVFKELVLKGKDYASNALQKQSNGAVKETVANNKYAIGYIGLGYVDESVKALKINGVKPTKENVKNGKYPISRRLYLITNGQPQGVTKKFIDFVLSEEGQRIVEQTGYIPIR